MIHEHFCASGAYEAAQGLADLFTMSVQNDDVPDSDVKWDRALLTVSEMLSDAILEGLYKSKIQKSVQFRILLAFYDQEVDRNIGTPNYQQ